MGNLPSFMELVEIHERRWGTTQYPGRPALSDLMKAPVVAMWRVGKRFTFSAHYEQSSLDKLIADVLIGDVIDRRKLIQIFVKQKPVEFRPTIVFEPAPEQKPNPNKERDPQETNPHIGLPNESKIIRTPAGERLKPGRKAGWLPGRNEIRIVEIVKKGPTRHIYECTRCHATQDAVPIAGEPRCPACGAVMELKA